MVVCGQPHPSSLNPPLMFGVRACERWPRAQARFVRSDNITPRRSILTISPLDVIVCCLLSAAPISGGAPGLDRIIGVERIIARWPPAPGGHPQNRLASISRWVLANFFQKSSKSMRLTTQAMALRTSLSAVSAPVPLRVRSAGLWTNRGWEGAAAAHSRTSRHRCGTMLKYIGRYVGARCNSDRYGHSRLSYPRPCCRHCSVQRGIRRVCGFRQRSI